MQDERGPGNGGGSTGGGFGGFGGGPRGGRFFDDMAGVAGGAFSALAGLRGEAEAAIRSQLEGMIQRLELVRREELDAAMELARRAREQSEALAARVAALEAKQASPFTGEPQWATGATAGESGGAAGGMPGGGTTPPAAPAVPDPEAGAPPKRPENPVAESTDEAGPDPRGGRD
ncbi:accessory factor UbiK family protein [Roseomonas sp. BN140053]|uniref:accessory factor UbiK family protein n=1 Tax=Roseomonas sp. BN140053 TaxID=3391898 RepID=UPI0039ECCE0C